MARKAKKSTAHSSRKAKLKANIKKSFGPKRVSKKQAVAIGIGAGIPGAIASRGDKRMQAAHIAAGLTGAGIGFALNRAVTKPKTKRKPRAVAKPYTTYKRKTASGKTITVKRKNKRR